MDIETLYIKAIQYFESIRTRCEFMKIYTYIELEEGNFAFYGLFKCKRRVMVKKVIIAPDGEIIDFFSL